MSATAPDPWVKRGAALSRWRCRRRSIRASRRASSITTAPGTRRRAPATARPGCRRRPIMSTPAPVRTAPEVMHDPHMHERGMLADIEHPELGPITVPTTPLRLHGSAKPPMAPSPKIGQHNDEIYGGWLGLSAAEIAALKEEGVI